MKKHYNSFVGLITASVILLSAVIFENIISAKAVPERHLAQVPPTTDGISSGEPSQERQNDGTVFYPATTPQPAQADVSAIKKAIEKAGLVPVEARYWKEVE